VQSGEKSRFIDLAL